VNFTFEKCELTFFKQITRRKNRGKGVGFSSKVSGVGFQVSGEDKVLSFESRMEFKQETQNWFYLKPDTRNPTPFLAARKSEIVEGVHHRHSPKSPRKT
jgi:hypothetical protein